MPDPEKLFTPLMNTPPEADWLDEFVGFIGCGDIERVRHDAARILSYLSITHEVVITPDEINIAMLAISELAANAIDGKNEPNENYAKLEFGVVTQAGQEIDGRTINIGSVVVKISDRRPEFLKGDINTKVDPLSEKDRGIPIVIDVSNDWLGQCATDPDSLYTKSVWTIFEPDSLK